MKDPTIYWVICVKSLVYMVYLTYIHNTSVQEESNWGLFTRKVFSPCPLLSPANEVWGKVMFLRLCVILFTGGICMMSLPVWQPVGGGIVSVQEDLCLGGSLSRGSLSVRGLCLGGSLLGKPPTRTPPPYPSRGPPTRTPPPRTVKSGQYTSYWNAFLLNVIFLLSSE